MRVIQQRTVVSDQVVGGEGLHSGWLALAVSIGLGALVPPTQASAQAAVDDQQDGLEDIIVTAQKRAEPLQSVPVAVSAFSAAALERANATTFTSLQGLVPGLTMARATSNNGLPQMSLRGISFQDSEKSGESGIGVTIDGIPLAFGSGMLLTAFDVERIEVLRGPQGLLFGKNTTGGTINVIRTRPNPDADLSGKLRFTTGSFGRQDYEAVIMAPLIAGKLAVKGAFALQKNNGEYRNVVYGGREGDRDFKDYSLTVVATPTDRLNLMLGYERMEDDSQIPPAALVATRNPVPLGPEGSTYVGGANIICTNPFLAAACPTSLDKGRNTVENVKPVAPAFYHLDAVTFEGAYDLDKVKFVLLSGYRKTNEFLISDFDWSRFGLFRDKRAQSTEQFTAESRIETNFDGPFNVVAGAFYLWSKYNISQTVSVDRAITSIAIQPGVSFLNSASAYNVTQSARSTALFFQANYRLTDQLNIIFGARQTWDRKSLDYTSFLPYVSGTRDYFTTGPIASQTRQTAHFKKMTPKVGLEYKAAKDVLVYGSYSRGYNTGGFNGRASTAALVGPYQPETMDAFEVGFKSAFLNNHLRFNLAAYRNTLKNKQEDVLTIVGSIVGTTTFNVAKARYQGVEVDLAVVPLRGWTINASGGYLDAKYLSFLANLGQGMADFSALKLRRAPKWTAGGVSDYVFDAGPGEVGLTAAMTYVSRFETNPLNDPRGSIPPTTKVDLSARYTFPATSSLEVTLAGFIKNVTDNTTYQGNSSGNSRGTVIDVAIPSVGRTWGASLMAKF